MPGLSELSPDSRKKLDITKLKSAKWQDFSDICEKVIPSQDHKELLAAINNAIPGPDFELRLEHGGWHRQGGVVTQNFERVAKDIKKWAEQNFDEDGLLLDIEYDGEDLLATKLEGVTIYLVAQTGQDPEDFVQLQIEHMQEKTDHVLMPEGFIPFDIEELIDPPEPVKVEPEPIGEPYYQFRRVSDVCELVQVMGDAESHNKRFVRFMADWNNSSAVSKTRFSDHWVLKLFHFTDRFGELRAEATPIAANHSQFKLAGGHVPRGAELSNLLQQYDHEHGYPMAWYFALLVMGNELTQTVIRAVHQDLSSGLDYLPGKDAEIIRAWFREPYYF